MGLVLAFACAPARAQGTTELWQGWYGGGALGVAWTGVDVAIPPSRFSDDYNGITGGLLGGNNFFVTDDLLLGFEADITFSDLSGDVSFARHKVSLLGRAGWFPVPSLLVFGVIGLAGGQYEAKVTTTTFTFDGETETLIATTANSSHDKRLWGLALGGGFENTGVLFGQDMRWGFEYRYTDFPEWDFTVAGQGYSVEPNVHEARFRLVFPIGGDSTP